MLNYLIILCLAFRPGMRSCCPVKTQPVGHTQCILQAFTCFLDQVSHCLCHTLGWATRAEERGRKQEWEAVSAKERRTDQ